MTMAVHLVVGVILTVALIPSLLISGFIIFVVSSVQQVRSATNVLLFQLGLVNLLLAMVFLAFSAPSLLQDKWITAEANNVTSEWDTPYTTSAYDFPIISSEMTWPLELSLISPPSNVTSSDISSVTGKPLQNVVHFTSSNYISNETTKLMKPIRNAFDSSFGNGSVDSAKKKLVPQEESVVFGYSHDNVFVENKGMKSIDNVHIGEGLFCQIYGWILITLHVAAVWLIVGIQCDKFCAIAAPLRYSTLVTRRRVVIYSGVVWLIAVATASSPLATAQVYIYVGGACLPAWHVAGSLPYTICFAIDTMLIPGIVIVVVNIRILIIARHHQHKIFSAIFEVMMSAQATVTHQQNPFDAPKRIVKSTQSVIEQLLAFGICYCPIFVVALWEACIQVRIHNILETFGVGTFLVAPLINSFLYGVKCKSLRKSFKNYLRIKLYKSEVKSEIEGRVPSGQNSRRPSLSSSIIAMPIIHKSLKRRMSDYLMKDLVHDEIETQGRMARRSSDLSWHPLEDGTPSPNRLRKPFDVNIQSSFAETSAKSVSQYLTVPSFEAARFYCQSSQSENDSSISADSDCASNAGRDNNTEDELVPASYGSPPKIQGSENGVRIGTERIANDFGVEFCNLSRKFSGNSYSLRDSHSSSCTPLLISAYEKIEYDKPVNTSSPYIARTLDALMSIGLSQSLLKTSSLWRSKESVHEAEISINKCTYVSVPIEIVENVQPPNCQEMVTFINHVKNTVISKNHVNADTNFSSDYLAVNENSADNLLSTINNTKLLDVQP